MLFSGCLRALVLGASCVTATATLAQPIHYHCKFRQEATDGNWLPAEVDLIHDSDAGLVRVIDPVIYTFKGGPIEGRKATETKARITFVWDLQTLDSKHQPAKMHYSLTYFRNGVPAAISAQPGGYANVFDAQGTCKLSSP